MSEKVAFKAIVKGVVQGVFYRAFSQEEATARGITGYARNLWDGSVEVVAEGEKGILLDFLKALHRGPPSAHVTGVEVEWKEYSEEYIGFTIRR
ncbi:MAG: acylphosphatase [Candidatus Edwardsbacteria bacterium]